MKRKKSWKHLVLGTILIGALWAGSVVAWATPASGTSVASNIVVRESAVSGLQIGSLTAGQAVSIIGETVGSDGNTWYQISYTLDGETKTGWVRGDLLDTSDEPLAEEETTESEATASDASTGSIPASVIPEGFALTTVTYGSQEVDALVNGDIYLLYLGASDEGDDGTLVVYDPDSGQEYPYIYFATESGYVIVLNIPDDEMSQVSNRFANAVCIFDDGAYNALQLISSDDLVDKDASVADFYYIYGANETGACGWYVYNAADGTIQKNVMSMSYSLTEAETEDQGTVSDSDVLSSYLPYILGGICLVLLICLIAVSSRCRRLKRSVTEKKSVASHETPALPTEALQDCAPIAASAVEEEIALQSAIDESVIHSALEEGMSESVQEILQQETVTVVFPADFAKNAKAAADNMGNAGEADDTAVKADLADEGVPEQAVTAGVEVAAVVEAAAEEPMGSAIHVTEEPIDSAKRSAREERRAAREEKKAAKAREEALLEQPYVSPVPDKLADVMDLDEMNDEDYEALLNKYLDENFASEIEAAEAEEVEEEKPPVRVPADDLDFDFLDDEDDEEDLTIPEIFAQLSRMDTERAKERASFEIRDLEDELPDEEEAEFFDEE